MIWGIILFVIAGILMLAMLVAIFFVILLKRKDMQIKKNARLGKAVIADYRKEKKSKGLAPYVQVLKSGDNGLYPIFTGRRQLIRRIGTTVNVKYLKRKIKGTLVLEVYSRDFVWLPKEVTPALIVVLFILFFISVICVLIGFWLL